MFVDMTKPDNWRPIGTVLRRIAARLAAQKINAGSNSAPGASDELQVPGTAGQGTAIHTGPRRFEKAANGPRTQAAAEVAVPLAAEENGARANWEGKPRAPSNEKRGKASLLFGKADDRTPPRCIGLGSVRVGMLPEIRV